MINIINNILMKTDISEIIGLADGGEVQIERVSLPERGLAIEGQFALPPLARLSQDDQIISCPISAQFHLQAAQRLTFTPGLDLRFVDAQFRHQASLLPQFTDTAYLINGEQGGQGLVANDRTYLTPNVEIGQDIGGNGVCTFREHEFMLGPLVDRRLGLSQAL